MRWRSAWLVIAGAVGALKAMPAGAEKVPPKKLFAPAGVIFVMELPTLFATNRLPFWSKASPVGPDNSLANVLDAPDGVTFVTVVPLPPS